MSKNNLQLIPENADVNESNEIWIRNMKLSLLDRIEEDLNKWIKQAEELTESEFKQKAIEDFKRLKLGLKKRRKNL